MEAGTATGWQATDWVEDIMLRTTSPENYAAWIAGDLDFTSPEVERAFTLAGEMWFTPGFVASIPDITTTSQRVPMDPMFPTDGNWEGFTPGCWMQKQATWYGPDFFPDKRADPTIESQYVIGEDIGIFYFPMIDEEFGTPALGAGDTLMIINPPATEANPDRTVRNEVKAFVQFMSFPEATQRWIEAGSAISANVNTPEDWYAGAYKLAVGADIVANATSFGFDASDLMPPEVGAGTFWTESVRWIESEGADLPGVLQAIENSWPAAP
jgi:alpha-glucoside transport system substrate-binding protein